MRSILLAAGVLAATLFLGSATLVSASAVGEDESTVATAPSSHGDDDDDGEGHGHGPPPDRGRPDGVGKPEHAGLSSHSAPPQLPEHASARAHEAVALAFERQLAIQERVAAIRSMPPGPEKGPAVSALMKEFGQLYQLTGDALESDDS